MSLFSERLIARRNRLNLTQEALAERSGISSSSIAVWEGGKNLPTSRMMEKLAAALGVSPGWLMGGSHEVEGTSSVPMRDAPMEDGELELWKRRAKAAEKKLNDLRAALRSLIDLSSDSPQSDTSSELAAVLRAAGEQAEFEIQSAKPKRGVDAPSVAKPSPSGAASPGTSGEIRKS